MKQLTQAQIDKIPYTDVTGDSHPVNEFKYIHDYAHWHYSEERAHMVSSVVPNMTAREAKIAQQCERAIRRHYYTVYLPHVAAQQGFDLYKYLRSSNADRHAYQGWLKEQK